MKTTKFRVSIPENYTDKQGNEKTFWHDIGELTSFLNDDGTVKGRQLHIPAFNLKAQVFAKTAKEDDVTYEPVASN